MVDKVAETVQYKKKLSCYLSWNGYSRIIQIKLEPVLDLRLYLDLLEELRRNNLEMKHANSMRST